ncbi:DUF3153 domain-containing protein [Pseudonocardia humida]|uniref:DUF3153 domain-containing protein n=1 Tax=Pseudonocardia humida TaxID=2800819 RepID=UPI00207C7DF5|nr:DUF3153 domain-containing protein [Pseudonocardia humida]
MPRPPSRPTTTVRPRPVRRSRGRALPLLLAVLVLGLLVGGCARVRTALAVQPDDTVAGEVVLATPEQNPEDKGPKVTVPPELADAVDVSEYRQDGYVGSLLRFSDLTFEQVGQLNRVVGEAGTGTVLELRRQGNRVIVTGSIDLTRVPVDKADFQLKISFPGEVTETNGEADSGTVSWTFTPGDVGDINAIAAFDDPNAPSALNWTLGLSAIVVLTAAAVVVMARRTRNPPVSPRR